MSTDFPLFVARICLVHTDITMVVLCKIFILESCRLGPLLYPALLPASVPCTATASNTSQGLRARAQTLMWSFRINEPLQELKASN